eukprot:7162730-Ditylum_brightwellii.AAC.1
MSKGFNAYVEQQEECQDFFQDADQPKTDEQLAAKGQLHVRQNGLFLEKNSGNSKILHSKCGLNSRRFGIKNSPTTKLLSEFWQKKQDM